MTKLEMLGVIALTLGGMFAFDQLLALAIRRVRPAYRAPEDDA